MGWALYYGYPHQTKMKMNRIYGLPPHLLWYGGMTKVDDKKVISSAWMGWGVF